MQKRHPYSLIGIDGNAFSIINYTIKAMKQCGYSNDAIECYKQEAFLGDYDNLLSVSCTMIDNCNKSQGFDDFQQLMKGHDNLTYVDAGFGGVQNRRENLVNESFELDDEYDIEDDENFIGDDSYRHVYATLYKYLQGALDIIKSRHIPYNQIIIKRCINELCADDDFWEYDIDMPLPEKREINEAASQLQTIIKNYLVNAINNLLDDPDIEFSQYDVKVALTQILLPNSKIWIRL